MANESHETKIRPLPTFSESSFLFDKQARIYFSSNLVPPHHPFPLPSPPPPSSNSNCHSSLQLKEKKVSTLQIKEIYSKGFYICSKRKLLHFLNLRSEILVQRVFEICGLCCDLVNLIFVDFDLLNSISLSQIYSLFFMVVGFLFFFFLPARSQLLHQQIWPPMGSEFQPCGVRQLGLKITDDYSVAKFFS